MSRLADKVILVTGGTAGIGRTMAVALAREGARVVVTGRSRSGGEATLKAMGEHKGDAIVLTQDVTQEDQWVSTIKAVLDRHTRLDGLVNCAGASVLKPMEQMATDEFRQMLKVNLEGAFLGLKHAIPAMEKTGGGSVVNIGAMESMRGTANATAYGSSKGGLAALGKAAALESKAAGVRVNAVHPGFVYGASTVAALGEAGAKAARESIVARTPLGRAGEAEDFSSIVVYLMSDESRHTTAADIVIDGGLIAV